MTQDYTFLASNVNTNSMSGDQPDMRNLFRTGGDGSRGTARPNEPNKGIPADGQIWFDSIARFWYVYSTSKTGGPGWVPLFQLYEGTVLNSPVNPALVEAYPKGSIYISDSPVNPGEPGQLGYGQWQLYGEGRALCGVGTNTSEGYTINEGEQLGTAFPTLPADALPPHKHNFSVPGLRDWNVLVPVVPVGMDKEQGTDNLVTGVPANAGNKFTHIPPYAPVYIWVRGTDNLDALLMGDSALSATLEIEPGVLGPTTQTSQNMGNMFNQAWCPTGGGTPFQGNTPWTGYSIVWDNPNPFDDNYYSWTRGGQFEVLKTFSFYNNTTQQTIHTFNQGLTIASGINGTDPRNAFCFFALTTDTDAEGHGFVEGITPPDQISYMYSASTITPQPPSWWGDEIIVVPGAP